MTRKSRARIDVELAKGNLKLTPRQQQHQQQNALPEIKIWDEVENLRLRANEATAAAGYVLPLIRSQPLLLEIKKQGMLNEFIDAAKVLGKDSTEFRTQLNAISEKHRGKTGNCSDDELLDGLAIGEEYVAFINSYNVVVLPTIQQLTEIAERVGSAHVLSQADDVVAEQVAE